MTNENMCIIREIKAKRIAQLTEEQKNGILNFLKARLINEPYAVIDGASHYQIQEWRERDGQIWRAPFKFHPAIADWLHTLGFATCRYFNRGGVDNGMKVWC